MSSETNDGLLYGVYRDRVGEPTTHDEVRGYWVFLTGLVLGTLGILLFLPSTSAVGSSGLTIREASVFIAAIGLAMLVAGPVIRLPLQPWANYAAYLGQVVCFAAAVWFVLVFPSEWSVQTGNQPVIVLYAIGLAIITVVGLVAPLLSSGTHDELAASQGRTSELESELSAVRDERDRLETELDEARSEAETGAAAQSELQATLDSLRKSQARFELYEDAAEQWRWRLRHRNGNVVADSGEGYTRKHNAQKGMQSVRRNALGAETLLFEREAELPDEEADFEPVEEQESQAAFEVEEDSAGEYRFRLRHENGNILGDGGEGYSSRSNAKRAVDRVREYVGPADYLWFDPTGFEVYQDEADEWRWRLVHRNGNVLADGGEGYTRRNDANRAVDRIRENVDDLEFEVYDDSRGETRWRLHGANGQIVADSGEGYSSRDEAEEAVDRVREYAPEADVLEVGRAAFEIYEDRGGEHRWRLRHRNGNILMDSGQGYADRSGARDGIESVKRDAPNAELDE
ncbi:HVO_2922 family protein [Halosimplex aquaticum]|uniref:HVO_2922 family protein n=1 Tax=Halosimplex aquaticum TaxID=3026162 RepID=A0ABD5Y332_9EURY|nr:HVO_2922 family protein [Halosimplex aquaticum]